MARVISPFPLPSLLDLVAVRKPPTYALTARAKISVLIPQRPLSRKIGHCTFTIFRDSVEGQVENADGRLCFCELDHPKDVVRNVFEFLRLSRVTVTAIALCFAQSVPSRMKSAAKRAYSWLLRQLKKQGRRAA